MEGCVSVFKGNLKNAIVGSQKSCCIAMVIAEYDLVEGGKFAYMASDFGEGDGGFHRLGMS